MVNRDIIRNELKAHKFIKSHFLNTSQRNNLPPTGLKVLKQKDRHKCGTSICQRSALLCLHLHIPPVRTQTPVVWPSRHHPSPVSLSLKQEGQQLVPKGFMRVNLVREKCLAKRPVDIQQARARASSPGAGSTIKTQSWTGDGPVC